ncbi:potassium channel family protein [Pelagicoccus albus]|uniref:Potassium channel protein n=1 Tax=Pelagicoccus albus TaxID=415222 RepID=A0A7X1B4M7_9BACT|nr:potassium channel protein [Pelagicoccus albus]MBC2605566.1 potassium channel protein [Pelagicoccus albus]
MLVPTKQLLLGIVLFLIVVIGGFLGFRIAGWETLDAAYMVIITVFGVGYGESGEMTPGLKIFTIFFIIAGCTSLIYILGAFINWLTEGQLQRLLGKRKMQSEINHTSNHVILCGYGRIGVMVASHLKQAGRPFVVIDNSATRIETIKEAGMLCIEGDATEESVLERAGIQRADTLASLLPSDAANVFIVLSAKGLNPGLDVIARGVQPSSEPKLLQAGANRVVMPSHIGAERVAQLILKPSAREVLDQELRDTFFLESLNEIGLEVDEVRIDSQSELIGQTLEKLETRGKSAFIIVAVRREGGELLVKPALSTQIHAGDSLIVICHEGTIPAFVRGLSSQPVRQYRGAKVG